MNTPEFIVPAHDQDNLNVGSWFDKSVTSQFEQGVSCQNACQNVNSQMRVYRVKSYIL